MMRIRPSGPFDDPDQIGAALREQEATPAEIAAWSPIVRQMATWPDRQITRDDSQRLLAMLAPLLPPRSPVRQAVRQRYGGQQRLSFLLTIARTQVSVLRPAFWYVSAGITLLGAWLVLGQRDAAQSALPDFYLRALGPLLAYLGVNSAFRGFGLHTLEWELACPPSLAQLLIARLAVVLGYDVALGLALGAVSWLHGDSGFFLVTLYWLMPLLLVTGGALLLSLCWPVQHATALAYGGWVALLTISAVNANNGQHGLAALLANATCEIVFGLIGLVLLAVTIWRFSARVASLLPLA